MSQPCPSVKCHRRQFIICREDSPVSGWLSTKLPDGFHIHHDPDLTCKQEQGVLILGHKLNSGGGRYAEISWPYVRSDPVGMMALFFDEHAISSSPALVAPAADMTALRFDGMNWHPSPGSDGMGILLRDQQFHCLLARPEPYPRPLTSLESGDPVATLAEVLRSDLAELSASGSRLLLAWIGRAECCSALDHPAVSETCPCRSTICPRPCQAFSFTEKKLWFPVCSLKLILCAIIVTQL